MNGTHAMRALLCSIPLAPLAIAGCGGVKAPAIAHPGGFTVTPEQRARLTVDTVRLSTFRPAIEATGTVTFNGDRSTQVLAFISGPVARLVAPLGAEVGPGDVLATVRSPDFAAAVATLRKAEAANASAIRATARAQALFRNDALARADLDQATTDSVGTAADLEAAIQALRALGATDSTLASMRAGAPAGSVEAAIRAPIRGTVVERMVNPGQVLGAGATPTFTIADLSTMWVNASVYADDIALVRIGEPVDITVDGATEPVRGTVDYVAPIVDPASRAIAVRIVAANVRGLLRRDLFVQVRIHAAAEQHGLLVPAAAVQRDDENLPFVFVANADGSFGRRRITLGRRAEQKYEVVAGIGAGDRIVSDGALFLKFAESQ